MSSRNRPRPPTSGATRSHGSARAIALEAVRRVTERDGYSNIVIAALLSESRLERRDRAFTTELAYGTLRRLLTLDRAIDAVATRPIGRITPRALAALRLGAYQILYTDVPLHAAVSETVALAAPSERGFVNAVLRRIAAAPPTPPPPSPPPPTSAPTTPAGRLDEAVAARTGLSVWAVAELRRIVGDETEEAARALAERAPLCIRVNTCLVTLERVMDALREAGHEPLLAGADPDCLLVPGAAPATLPGFREGWFAVQDQASAFVVRALDPQPGEHIWDACAGPGGKAASIACSVGPDGLVVASDLYPRRAARVRREASRLGVHPLVLSQDATQPAIRGSFDRVLVDAPCSGIGAARRRPELLWRPRKEALSPLARLQVAIVSRSADLLRPGGRLVYAVCTFPRAETDAAADAIVRHRPDLRPVATPGPSGTVLRHRLWPHRDGSDGMFVAAFERDP